MDFQLDIGELTNTINEYENFTKILSEQKENINKAVKELTDLGWSGEAKDKFLENHMKKQEFYTKLEEDIKYMKSALENGEKPKAVQLKKRSEDFENCIKRSGGAALTSDDMGVISLQYGGQFPINNNVNECTNDYYRRMNSKFEEILSLVNSLTFTSFPITGDVLNAENSLRDQTMSLTEFNNSFNVYCSGVRAMEDNICSVFGKISGVTEGISKFRDVSIISENGQVDKNEVRQLMLKNPNNLTNEEKELLSYVEKVLGKDEYVELKKLAMKENNDSSFWEPVWDFEEGVDNFLAQHFNNPFGKFMSRISITAGNVVTCGNGSKEVADTGSPAADKIADIIGVCGGVLFNPEAGLEGSIGMVNGVKGFHGFLARKIKNIGNNATEYTFENMGQYIRSVLYGQHQFALPNGGKITTSEDLFKFAKGEGKGAGKAVELTAKDIPSAKSGQFNQFFNSLTTEELDELWKNKSIRKKIERELRAPGGLHEWHLVSQAPKFKYWDVSAEQIKDLRSVISDVKFKNPSGQHGGLGSTKAHNELISIIESSNDYNSFIRRLNNWANYRLEGGINSLPEGLRLK